MTIARGEVWLVNLDPTIGSEIRKTRPALVVSPPEIHDHLRTAIIAPMTTGSRPAPFRVPLTFQGKSGLIVLDQLRTVDRVRLVRRLGTVEPAVVERALSALRAVFEV